MERIIDGTRVRILPQLTPINTDFMNEEKIWVRSDWLSMPISVAVHNNDVISRILPSLQRFYKHHFRNKDFNTINSTNFIDSTHYFNVLTKNPNMRKKDWDDNMKDMTGVSFEAFQNNRH
jgi:hypothetical protein